MARFLFARCFIPTFKLPTTTDGRALAGTSFGSYLGTTTNGVLPNITGIVNAPVYGALTPPSGVFYAPSGNWTTLRGDAAAHPPTAFDASRSSALYANNTTQVRAASVFIAFCIKY